MDFRMDLRTYFNTAYLTIVADEFASILYIFTHLTLPLFISMDFSCIINWRVRVNLSTQLCNISQRSVKNCYLYDF